MSSSSSQNEPFVPKRKKTSDPQNYKRNKIKLARSKGEEYLSHRGKKVPAKAPGISCG